MRRIFTSIAPTIITGAAGLITFATFLIPALAGWRVPLVGIAVIVAGVAVVMGFVHLVYVHIHRIRRGGAAAASSGVLIIAAIITLIVLFVDHAAPDHLLGRFIFDHIIVSMQSALGALLAVLLALAAFRMLQRKRRAGAIWFLLAALIVLITQVPLPLFAGASMWKLVRDVLDAVMIGGMRGLLLGVALGTLATAFRVLFFIDRPQSE